MGNYTSARFRVVFGVAGLLCTVPANGQWDNGNVSFMLTTTGELKGKGGNTEPILVGVDNRDDEAHLFVGPKWPLYIIPVDALDDNVATFKKRIIGGENPYLEYPPNEVWYRQNYGTLSYASNEMGGDRSNVIPKVIIHYRWKLDSILGPRSCHVLRNVRVTNLARATPRETLETICITIVTAVALGRTPGLLWSTLVGGTGIVGIGIGLKAMSDPNVRIVSVETVQPLLDQEIGSFEASYDPDATYTVGPDEITYVPIGNLQFSMGYFYQLEDRRDSLDEAFSFDLNVTIANADKPEETLVLPVQVYGQLSSGSEPCVVPTLCGWNLIVMTLLVLAAGTIVVYRRRSATRLRSC